MELSLSLSLSFLYIFLGRISRGNRGGKKHARAGSGCPSIGLSQVPFLEILRDPFLGDCVDSLRASSHHVAGSSSNLTGLGNRLPAELYHAQEVLNLS